VSVISRSSIDIYVLYSLFHIKMQPGGSTDRAGFRHESFLRSILHCVIQKIQESAKLYFFLELCPKLWTLKISLQYVDHQNVSSASSSRNVVALQRDKLDRRQSTNIDRQISLFV